MNESKKHLKCCENCYHYSKSFYDNDNNFVCRIYYVGVKPNFNCDFFCINHAKHMYPLCSCSECLDCEYFIKEFHYCNLGGKKI